MVVVRVGEGGYLHGRRRRLISVVFSRITSFIG